MSVASSIVAAFPAPYQQDDFKSEIRRHLSDASYDYEEDVLAAAVNPAGRVDTSAARAWAYLGGKQVYPLKELSSEKLLNLESGSRIFFVVTVILAVASAVLASYALPFVPVLLTALGAGATDLVLHSWANHIYKKIDGALLAIQAGTQHIPDVSYQYNGKRVHHLALNFSARPEGEKIEYTRCLLDLARNDAEPYETVLKA